MESKTTVYVKLDIDQEVKVELAHVTEADPAPHEKRKNRELTAREMNHVSRRLQDKDYTFRSTL